MNFLIIIIHIIVSGRILQFTFIIGKTVTNVIDNKGIRETLFFFEKKKI